MPDNSTEITVLEEILNAGASSVTTDGLTTTWDLGEVRRRLLELKQTDDQTIVNGNKRPVFTRIRLG